MINKTTGRTISDNKAVRQVLNWKDVTRNVIRIAWREQTRAFGPKHQISCERIFLRSTVWKKIRRAPKDGLSITQIYNWNEERAVEREKATETGRRRRREPRRRSIAIEICQVNFEVTFVDVSAKLRRQEENIRIDPRIIKIAYAQLLLKAFATKRIPQAEQSPR